MTRTVLVTGGTSGIGAAVARTFRDHGDHVIITGRSPRTVEPAANELAVTGIACDATIPSDVASLAEQLPDSVDVIFNSAGGLVPASAAHGIPPLEKTARQWADYFALNVTSAVLTVEVLSDRLTEGGRVVSVGSIAADTGSSSYGAAKAALASWNVSLSRSLAVKGVTCNVISAGYITETNFFGDAMTSERHDRLVEQTHNKRAGVVDDIAQTGFFLASPGASHITGQTIHVNGGAFTTR